MNATTTRIRRHHRRTKRTTINVDTSDNGSAKDHSLAVEGRGEKHHTEKHNEKDGKDGKEGKEGKEGREKDRDDKNGLSKRRRFILRRKQLLAKKVA